MKLIQTDNPLIGRDVLSTADFTKDKISAVLAQAARRCTAVARCNAAPQPSPLVWVTARIIS